MHTIIDELLKKGFEFVLSYDKETSKHLYTIGGVYKSGTCSLYEEDGRLFAIARYNEVTELTTLYDLVYLNYNWWVRSKERYDGWSSPDQKWLPLLLREGLVVKKEEIVTRYE